MTQNQTTPSEFHDIPSEYDSLMSDLLLFVRHRDTQFPKDTFKIHIKDLEQIGREKIYLEDLILAFEPYVVGIRHNSIAEYASKYELFLGLYQTAKFAHKIMAERKFLEIKHLVTLANNGKQPPVAPSAGQNQTEATLAFQFAGMIRGQYLGYLKKLKELTQFLGTHQLRAAAPSVKGIDPVVSLNKPFVSRMNAILILGKSEDTIDRWCRSGKLVSKKDAGRGVLIQTKEIRKILGYDK